MSEIKFDAFRFMKADIQRRTHARLKKWFLKREREAKIRAPRTLTLQEEVQVGTELQQHCLNEQFHNVAKLLDHLLSYSSSVNITENSIS